MNDIIKNNYKITYRDINVKGRNDPAVTYTVYSDTTDIDTESKLTQLFVGIRSLFSDIYGMKADNKF